MCDYCNGRKPLIRTNYIKMHQLDVGIYNCKIIAESYYHDGYSGERISKGVAINYCPMCGRSFNNLKGVQKGND